MQEKPNGSVTRALVVSGGCLIRPSHDGDAFSTDKDLFKVPFNRSDALSSLRDAVHRWFNEDGVDRAAIICADRGYDHARLLGLTPDLVVGDMDSMSVAGRAASLDLGHKLDLHPPRKEASDTEIAVLHALSMGVDQILMVAALGGRVDHELANVMLLVRLARQGRRAEALDNVCRLTPVVADRESAVARVSGSPGDLLTLIPFSDECQGVSLSGLEYPLSEDTLVMGTSRGVSNVFTESEATVALRRGILLAIVTFADSEGGRAVKRPGRPETNERCDSGENRCRE